MLIACVKMNFITEYLSVFSFLSNIIDLSFHIEECWDYSNFILVLIALLIIYAAVKDLIPAKRPFFY